MALKKHINRIRHLSVSNELETLQKMLERNSNALILDLGCGKGEYTVNVFSKKIDSNRLVGVDIDAERCYIAQESGISIVQANLNEELPFRDSSFDVILAHQVIEHLYNNDTFIDEVWRILKDGGYGIIATENLASWHNIFSLIMGWQPFSENISDKSRIGNPLYGNLGIRVPFSHQKVFTYKSLIDFMNIHNFKIDEIRGSGYYLLPGGIFGKFFSRLDPRHAHYIMVKIRKKHSFDKVHNNKDIRYDFS
jgi:SAM-dependent methyltransferase